MLRFMQSKQCFIAGLIVFANFTIFLLYALQGGEESQSVVQEVEVAKRKPRGEISVVQYEVILPDRPGYIPPLVVYNRVPKTGSTTFANIAYALAEQNHFNILHINTTFKNYHWFNVVDQGRFVRNISEWVERQPAIYHGHVHYMDFTRFGYRNPIYINIIREPLERLVSYYYFLRNGDDYRPHLRRYQADDRRTFDECVEQGGKGCNLDKLWIQVPFFCGQNSACIKPSRWALEQAKSNLISHYLIVGVTEYLEEFVVLLEEMLPYYFSGAHRLYTKGGIEHLRKTQGKLPPSEETLRRIKQSSVYQLESEFYLFAMKEFQFLKQNVFQNGMKNQGERLNISKPLFSYEKIAP